MARRGPSIADTSIGKYNAAYAARKDFVARPNAFLRQCLDRIAATRRGKARSQPCALDIGVGQGRNAMFLAHRGYRVLGIDRSDIGVRDAQQLAATRRLRIDAVVADSERFDYGRNQWDLIALLYYPQPMIIIEKLKAATKPGGHIVVERFSRPNHGKAAHAGDRCETKKPSPMFECFADWHVLLYEHDEFSSDWHWNGESPRGSIVRVLARKPMRRG